MAFRAACPTQRLQRQRRQAVDSRFDQHGLGEVVSGSRDPQRTAGGLGPARMLAMWEDIQIGVVAEAHAGLQTQILGVLTKKSVCLNCLDYEVDWTSIIYHYQISISNKLL